MIRALPLPKSGMGAKLLASLVVVLVGLSSPSKAEEPSFSDWFRYSDEAGAAWNFTAIEDDPMRVFISKKNPAPGAAARNIFVLYPKPSSAYDVAISRILQVLASKSINAQLTVVNFARDDDAGKKALASINGGDYELVFSMGSASTAWLWKN